MYRQNQRHLRCSREQPEENTTDFNVQPPVIVANDAKDSGLRPCQEPAANQSPVDQSQPGVEKHLTTVKITPVMSDGQQRTRSGRVVKKPYRYQANTI